MPADLNRDVQLADLLERASDRRARGQPAGAADLQTPPPLQAELDALLSAAGALDRAAGDWREAASAVETVAVSPSPDQPTGTMSPAARVPADPTALSRVGRYQIVRRVGAGGMGEVFEAYDPLLSRRVALKLPFLGPGGDVLRQRFVREARSAAAVVHPNVCRVVDAGDDGGRPFVVMDFVDGESLADRLARGRFEDPREAVTLLAKVAAGLAAVHARGIVHRDLKPGNILLDRAGNPLLSDFGLARPAEAGEPLTAEGSALGTPAYMAPEQASPSLGPTTARSDLYSLGVTMYQMLTGRLPCPGTPGEQLAQLVFGPGNVPPPSATRPGLDPRLDAIVRKATARSPDDRYASASDLAGDLGAWLASAPVPVPPKPTAPKSARRWRVPVAVAVAVLLGGLAVWAAIGNPGTPGGGLDDKKTGNDQQDPLPKKADPKQAPAGKTVKLDPDVLSPSQEKLPGLEDRRFVFDDWVDAPQGVYFLGGGRLRFQFGLAGERDVDLATGKVAEITLPNLGRTLAVAPDRKHWAGIDQKGVLGYYSAAADKPALVFRGVPPNSLGSISPDGQTLAVINAATDDRRLMTYSLKTGDQLSATTVELAGFHGFYHRPLWLDGGRAIGALVYSTQKLRFITRTPDGKPVGDYDAPALLHPLVGVTASADGSVAAAFGLDADRNLVVVAWRLQKGNQVPRFEEVLRYAAESPKPQGNLEGLRYLPYVSVSGDNKRLAFASGGAVRVWDLDTKALLLTVEVPTVGESPVTAGLSEDGKILLVRLKRSVRFLNVADGAPRGALVVLQQGPRYDQWVAVSPDGHYKASSKEAEAKVRVKATTQGTAREYPAAEFGQKFDWKNDPSKVKLLGD